MSEIAKGKIVELISGGPPMSVVDVADYNHTGEADAAKCVWFDAKKIKCEEVFDIVVLKVHVPPALGAVSVTRK